MTLWPLDLDTWARMPHSAMWALERGDLNYRQYGLIAYLYTKADYRTREVALTLAALADGCRWPWGRDLLRKELVLIRDAGWIDYRCSRGMRAPYVIRIPEIGANLGRLRSTPSQQPRHEDAPSRVATSDKTSDIAEPSEVTSDGAPTAPDATALPESADKPDQPRIPDDAPFFSTKQAASKPLRRDEPGHDAHLADLILNAAERMDERGYPAVSALGVDSGSERFAEWLNRYGTEPEKLAELLVRLDTGLTSSVRER